MAMWHRDTEVHSNRGGARRRACLGLTCLAAAMGTQTAAGAWNPAGVLVSPHPGDWGTFGRNWIAMDGDYTIVSDGALGAVIYGPSGVEAMEAAPSPLVAKGVAVTGNDAFIASGDYLYHYNRPIYFLERWFYVERWPLYRGGALDVAADGNIVAVSHDVGNWGGRVTMFEKVGGSWQFSDRIGVAQPYFGRTIDVHDRPDVALPNNTVIRRGRVIMGAHGATINGQAYAGAAYIYEQSNTTWSYDQTLAADSPFYGAGFGTDVALSQGYAFVAGQDGADNGDVIPSVAIFERASGWSRSATVTSPSPAWSYAGAIAADGDRLIVTGWVGSHLGGFAYERSGAAWPYRGTLTGSSLQASSAAISGNRAALGTARAGTSGMLMLYEDK